MLMSYKAEKFKEVTSVLYSAPSSEEQPFRYVGAALQSPLLTSSLKLVLVPEGQAHLSTRVGFLGTTSQWKEATGAGSAKQAQHSVSLGLLPRQTRTWRAETPGPSTVRRQGLTLNRALLHYVTLGPASNGSEPRLQDPEDCVQRRLSVTRLEESRAPCEVVIA